MIRRTMDATFLNTVANDLKTKARDAIIPISKVLILAAFWPYCEWKADR